MRNRLIVAAVCCVLLAACSEDTPNEPVVNNPATNDALVIVVENNEMFPSYVETAWVFFKDQVIPLFSDFFDVPEDSLRSRSFGEVIDDYGEPWILDRVEEAAGTSYSEVVRLTDRDATLDRLVSELERLKNAGYNIDVVFDMHASETTVLFDDRSVPVSEMTQAVLARGIRIRALFQTCCHASHHLDEWEQTGIVAVSGSFDTNYLTIYTPAGFVKYWTEGRTYADAVRLACEYEIEQTRALDERYALPYGYKMEPTESQIASSRMILAGSDTLATFPHALTRIASR